MNEKGLFSQLAAIPILALFLGIGALGIAAALTWDREMTQAALTAGAAICGGGVAVASILIGAFAGLALYKRATQTTDHDAPINGQWRELPRPDDAPPALADGNAGSWETPGPAAYDLAPRKGATTYARDAWTPHE